jgi:hypothetical protein
VPELSDDVAALLMCVIHDGLPSLDLVVRPQARRSIEGIDIRVTLIPSVMRSPALVLDP